MRNSNRTGLEPREWSFGQRRTALESLLQYRAQEAHHMQISPHDPATGWMK